MRYLDVEIYIHIYDFKQSYSFSPSQLPYTQPSAPHHPQITLCPSILGPLTTLPLPSSTLTLFRLSNRRLRPRPHLPTFLTRSSRSTLYICPLPALHLPAPDDQPSSALLNRFYFLIYENIIHNHTTDHKTEHTPLPLPPTTAPPSPIPPPSLKNEKGMIPHSQPPIQPRHAHHQPHPPIQPSPTPILPVSHVTPPHLDSPHLLCLR